MKGAKIGLLLVILAFGSTVETAWRVRNHLGPGAWGWFTGRHFQGPSFTFDAQQTEAAARLEAHNLVMAAEEQAASVVDEARSKAARMRAESDRELAAAAQRRDAINAQLGNVREMLATLTGSVSAPDALAAEEPGGAAEQVDDVSEHPADGDAEPARDVEPVEASSVESR